MSFNHARVRVHHVRRLRLRGVTVLAPLLLVGGMLTGGPAPASAAAPPLGCESVFFLGAIGSGEWADNHGQQSSTYLGPQVQSVLDNLRKDLPGRGIAASSLLYPAAAVETLTPSPGQIAAAASAGVTGALGPAWAVNDYLHTKLPPFMASISTGVSTATTLLASRAARCPTERIVLAGFSQGAMVMHEVVNKLYDTGQNATLARIGGVLLLADGDRVPNTMTNLTGGPVAGLAGKGIAAWQPGKARDIASPLIRARTFSICDKNDLVCDFQVWDIAAFAAAANIHGGPGYRNSAQVQVASSRVANIVRGWAAPTPPTQNANATTGQGFALLLTADARTGSVPRWRATSALPAGLSLSPTGLISGTPTTAGTRTVSYQVQAGPTGWASDWIPGTITIHTSTATTGGGGGQTQNGRISAGATHTCAVITAGGVKCWGGNTYGQLGDGTTTASSTPVGAVGLGSGVAAVSVGADNTCAVTTAGAVKCWGDNTYGQLGDGTTTSSSTPVGVVGLGSGVAAVSIGADNTCAVTTAGAVKCWGYNGYGELGDGTTTSSSTPVGVVRLGSGVAAVSVGVANACAVTTAGAVTCWGYNLWGLGDGTTKSSSTPVGVLGLGSGVAAVSIGVDHTCAVTTAGAVKCWGYDGELGNGIMTGSSTPVDVIGLGSGVAAISAGFRRSCAVNTDGAVKCWGANSDGMLGDGNTTSYSTPVNVVGLGSGVAAVTAGYNHSCAVTTTGAVKCWGYNGFGQLGNGTTANATTPVAVLGLP